MLTDNIDSLDRKAKQGVDSAYETFDSARQDAKELADQAVETGQQGFRQGKDTARKVWDQARKTGSQWGERVAEASKDKLDLVKSYARSRPVQTAAIALAVGIVIGGLIAASYSRED